MAPAQSPRVSDRVAVLRAAIRRLEANPVLSEGEKTLVSSGHDRLDDLLGGGLARGALHDLHAKEAADSAAATGFALGWARRAAREREGRPIIWIAEEHSGWENGLPYGPGLAAHGLQPESLILVRTASLADALWALEEALHSSAPAAVIGEMTGFPRSYDLTASRRLLLAAQAGRNLGLLVFAGVGGSGEDATSAAAARFLVKSERSAAEPGGGPGRAAWRIEVKKNRAGRTGEFSVEWNHDDRIFADPAAVLRDRLPHPAYRPPAPTPQVRRRSA
ncbi:hypothetical protein [Terrarubrum flagellatum]|uniref:ImuA family protein n=1 Tax=Terrirubrum flagellatum TaxID=2895980 RepID=UPI003145473F